MGRGPSPILLPWWVCSKYKYMPSQSYPSRRCGDSATGRVADLTVKRRVDGAEGREGAAGDAAVGSVVLERRPGEVR